MKVIIIEDEHAAAKNLTAILKELNESIEVTKVLESVSESIEWIKNNPQPDLAFCDIQLSDASIFDIFKSCKVEFPVIFTTAYSQYALKAFKVNSIDYILKPVNKDDVRFALQKFDNLARQSQSQREERIMSLLQELQSKNTGNYKKSFLVHYKDRLIPIEVRDFAYFFIEYGSIYGVTREKKKYVIDQKLELLEEQLNPEQFFRANRQYIVSRDAIQEVNKYFNSKLSLIVSPSPPEKITISKAKASEFKNWLEY